MSSLHSTRLRAREITRAARADPRTLVPQIRSYCSRGQEQLAFEICRASPAAVLSMTTREIESLLPSLHDWNSTDCFGCFVAGVAWREGTLKNSTISRWARSRNLWIRRAALVSTVPLNLAARGATAPAGEPRKPIAICTLLVDDREDMVVKGLSWALRVLARKDATAVRSFIAAHERRLAPRVLREVRNKLSTGLKNPKR